MTPPDNARAGGLPEPLDGRVSQTMLRHYARCPRSGFLYAKHRKAPGSTPEMNRGSAFHEVHERAVTAMVDADEHTIPPELVKAIVNEVLAELPVPLEEHDYVREMSYRWAEQTAIDPLAVVACETLFELDVAGWVVRCRVDYGELLDDGQAVRVVDYKTARGVPGFEDVARKRPDGSLAAKNFQLVLYGLCMVYGVPVREEPCGPCGGEGWVFGFDKPAGQSWSEPVDARAECPICRGRGRVETRDPFPVAPRAQRLELEFVYPGVEDRDGKMVRRPCSLSRAELDEYLQSFDGLLRRLAEDERTGEWPAVASHDACAECPAPAECPIPGTLRDFKGGLNTVTEASELAERLFVEKRLHAAQQRQLREFAKAHDVAIPFGDGMEMRLVYAESERSVDREGMLLQMERAVRYGEEFDRSRFFRVVGRTDFKAVKAEPKEVAVDDRSADEKWGADAPW